MYGLAVETNREGREYNHNLYLLYSPGLLRRQPWKCVIKRVKRLREVYKYGMI